MQYITPAYRPQKCTCVREPPPRLAPSLANTRRCAPTGTPAPSTGRCLQAGDRDQPLISPAAGCTHKNTRICFSQGKNWLKCGDAQLCLITGASPPQSARRLGVLGQPSRHRVASLRRVCRSTLATICRTMVSASCSSETGPSPCSALRWQALGKVPTRAGRTELRAGAGLEGDSEGKASFHKEARAQLAKGKPRGRGMSPSRQG